MSPQRRPCPDLWIYCLKQKRDFADVIKGTYLRSKEYPGLCRLGQCNWWWGGRGGGGLDSFQQQEERNPTLTSNWPWPSLWSWQLSSWLILTLNLLWCLILNINLALTLTESYSELDIHCQPESNFQSFFHPDNHNPYPDLILLRILSDDGVSTWSSHWSSNLILTPWAWPLSYLAPYLI